VVGEDLETSLEHPPRGTPEWWSRHWRRTAAGGAILVLLIGTHIPRLVLGPEDDGPDKLLHMGAFAIITMLLHVASPGRAWWRTGLLVLGLAIFDEVTQELPGLNRSFDPLDLVADSGGIAVALAWCGALGPPKRGPDWHRESHRRRGAGYRLLLASFANWMHIGVAGVLGAMLLGVLLVLIVRHPAIGPITMTVVGAETGLVAGVVAALEIGRRHASARIDAEQRCLACLVPGVAPGTKCVTCGATGSAASDGGEVGRGVLLPAIGMVVLAAVLLIVASLALGWLRFFLVRPSWILVWYDTLAVADAMAFDAIGLGLVGAVTIWWMRRRTAKRLETAGVRCLRCGHDLRGTPDDDGRGACSECGAAFRRGFAEPSTSGEHAAP
jgi:hypothetical protein